MQRSGYDPLPYFPADSGSKRTYKMLESYDGIIEPNVENTLYLSGLTNTDDYYYVYKVCTTKADTKSYQVCDKGHLYSTEEEGTSEGVTLSCSPYDELSITITKYASSTGDIKGISEGTLLCLYVRREIRSLSSNDLDAAMDAMYTIYSTSEEDGQEMYGEGFHNSTYYVKAHHFNAAWTDGDHIHEGLGFLPQHMKMTNLFEQGMQVVDASVSLPYWDFTIENDAELGTGGTPVGSVMFSPATFGTLEYPSDETFGYTYAGNSLLDSRIRDGRWKHILADVVYETPDGFDDLVKNFGYLRAPWNLNPSPFVSRFTNYNAAVPECSDHYDLVAKYDSLSDFLQVAPYAPHARIHGSIGSIYGCDKMAPMLEAGLIQSQTQQVLLCTQWPIILKVLYRKHFIEAADKDECTRPVIANVDSFSCGFSCMDDGSGAIEKYLYTLMHKYTGDTLTDDDWTTWKEFICEGDGPKIFAGDHLESASPADPSFWPVHPTLERLYQAKMMAGGFADTTWPESTDGSTESYICDRWQCFEKTETPFWGQYSECCAGHYKDDGLLDFESGDRDGMLTEGMGGMGNTEMLAASDPTNKDYSMPYVFDHFKWDHCQSLGVKIEQFVDGEEDSR